MCRKLYLTKEFHNCLGHKCRFCNQQCESKEAFRLHFYGPRNANHERVPCGVCNKLMPEGCRERHEPKCRGCVVRCEACNECYSVSPASNPRTITPEQHAAVCGLGYKFCANCNTQKPPGHLCVISRRSYAYDFKKKHKHTWFLDLECLRKGELGEQIVTCAVAREGIDPEEGETPETFRARLNEHTATTEEKCFTNLQDLCVWMYRSKNCQFVAHNMSGYDGPIIASYLMYDMGLGPKIEVTMVGLKVMYARFGSNSMIDSANHLKSRLDGLPKLVGLSIAGLQKGHFPHSFNTEEHRNYKGPLPGKECYNIEYSKENTEDFDAWHDGESLKYSEELGWWDIRAKELEYCKQDVKILMQCWTYHRYTSINLNGVDPGNCPTAAGYCLQSYRNAYIPERGISTLTPVQSALARRAVHGGRTEMRRAYADMRGTTKRAAVWDVRSLYPAVQSKYPMPDKCVAMHTHDDAPTQEEWIAWEGIVELVELHPPPYDPARPYRVPYIGATSKSGKYEFNWEVKHNIVLTIMEVRAAVELGYTVVGGVVNLHRYEAVDDMFKDFMMHFTKLKVENDDPPPAELEDSFVQGYKDLFGIELDRVELRKPKNKGAYMLFKLLMNGLWGKLTQRALDKSTLVDVAGWHKLMLRVQKKEAELVAVACDPHLPNVFSITYKELKLKDQMIENRTNPAVGAYVTAGGRHELYKVFGAQAYEESMLYCDTDSACLIVEPDFKIPEEGEFLGQWSREPGNFDECLFIAPKVYYLKEGDEPSGKNDKMKIKGFPVHNFAKDLFTFDNFKGLIVNEVERYRKRAADLDLVLNPDVDADDDDDDDECNVPERAHIAVPYPQFVRRKHGGMFVPTLPMTKVLRFNASKLKSRMDVTNPEAFFKPFGHGVERLPDDPNLPLVGVEKRPPIPKRVVTPMDSDHLQLLLGSHNNDEDEDGDAEMTDGQADAMMLEALAAMDQHQTMENIIIDPD